MVYEVEIIVIIIMKMVLHTSGAAYGGEPHHVANSSSGWKKFENPKSAILILIFESSNRFSA